jgi:hypothetical protein
MAEDIVASHPLLMTMAVLSGECVEKVEIPRKLHMVELPFCKAILP